MHLYSPIPANKSVDASSAHLTTDNSTNIGKLMILTAECWTWETAADKTISPRGPLSTVAVLEH